MVFRKEIKQFLDFPFPEALQYDRKHNLTSLPKGIQLITENYQSPLCTLGILLDVGSKNDGGSSGLAQISSQMLLSGTKSKLQSQVLSNLSDLGDFSIQVTRDSTWLQMITYKENLHNSFRLFGELFTESLYPNDVLNNIKKDLIRENEAMMLNPAYLIYENLHRVAFKGHGVGGFIRGDEDCIQNITRAEVAEFINSNYTSNNMTISACGAVDHNQVLEMIEKYL